MAAGVTVAGTKLQASKRVYPLVIYLQLSASFVLRLKIYDRLCGQAERARRSLSSVSANEAGYSVSACKERERFVSSFP